MMLRTGLLAFGFNHEKWLMVLITNHISKKSKRLLTFRHSSFFIWLLFWMKKKNKQNKGKRNPPQNHHHLHRFQFFSHEVASCTKVTADPSRQANSSSSDFLDWPWKNEVENWEEEEKFKLYSIDCVKHGIFFRVSKLWVISTLVLRFSLLFSVKPL